MDFDAPSAELQQLPHTAVAGCGVAEPACDQPAEQLGEWHGARALNAPPVVLIGAGGHARVCIDVIESEARFSIVGLVGLSHEVGTRILGYAVLGTDDDLPALLTNDSNVIVTVGQIKTPDRRIRLFDMLLQRGRTFPTIVSPRAYVSPHATLGAGSIVMHGAVVNAGASIGRNCIINSQALVEHDAVIGDHCHISTASVINGAVRVNAGTFVGSNSSVRENAVIGARCVIGMGQRVLADCPDGTWLPPKRSRS